jgi:hypothetical protein
MDPVVLASARRHGIRDEDMFHTYRHPVRVFTVDGLTMLIGGDSVGRLVEVGVVSAGDVDFIVHAMVAREKFLR